MEMQDEKMKDGAKRNPDVEVVVVDFAFHNSLDPMMEGEVQKSVAHPSIFDDLSLGHLDL